MNNYLSSNKRHSKDVNKNCNASCCVSIEAELIESIENHLKTSILSALTIAECEVGCPPPDEMPEPVTMKLDRPFAFAITGEYDELLFMGVVRNME